MGRFRARLAVASMLLTAVAGVAAPTVVQAAQGCQAIRPPAPKPAAMSASVQDLQVPAGETGDFDLVLDLTSRAAPIDIFFALDSSTSMQNVIEELKESFSASARVLAGSGIDLHAGLADFNDIDGNPYTLRLPADVVDCRFNVAMEDVRFGGAGKEPHLVAIHQALTGSGFPERRVPAGQQAGFRTYAQKIIIVATDAQYSETIGIGPGFDLVAKEFRDRGVFHVGVPVFEGDISIGNPTGPIANNQDDPNEARASMERMGTATGTVARGLGIDCNGDGVPDVLPGQPVVCNYDNRTTAVVSADVGAIVEGVVQGLRTDSPVDLLASPSGALGVQIAEPRSTVDLTQDNRIQSAVSVICPADAAGEQYPVTFSGRAATSSASRNCDACAGVMSSHWIDTPRPSSR